LSEQFVGVFIIAGFEFRLSVDISLLETSPAFFAVCTGVGGSSPSLEVVFLMCPPDAPLPALAAPLVDPEMLLVAFPICPVKALVVPVFMRP